MRGAAAFDGVGTSQRIELELQDKVFQRIAR